ncbi:MAG: hypothetical protein ACI4XW_04370 [Candidatus Spyradocola sp.]
MKIEVASLVNSEEFEVRFGGKRCFDASGVGLVLDRYLISRLRATAAHCAPLFVLGCEQDFE